MRLPGAAIGRDHRPGWAEVAVIALEAQAIVERIGRGLAGELQECAGAVAILTACGRYCAAGAGRTVMVAAQPGEFAFEAQALRAPLPGVIAGHAGDGLVAIGLAENRIGLAG